MAFTHKVMHNTWGKIFLISKSHVLTFSNCLLTFYNGHRFLGNLHYLKTSGRFEEELHDFQGKRL